MSSSSDHDAMSTAWHRPSSPLQEELALLLDRYASALEAGRELEADQILAQHPVLAEHMGGHLESLQLLCRATRSVELGRVAQQPAEVTPEADLGDYRIEREIGRGGMGIVYAARQLSLGRRVALKVLPFASVLDQQQVARFRNEAQAAASLHHPHIVPVYGVGCERGVHYYSMQLIDGQSLEQAIDELRGRTARSSSDAHSEGRDGSISPGAGAEVRTRHPLSTAVSIRNKNFIHSAVELIIHVAEAIDYAHRQGVVHRDIKPSNLLLDASGKIWVTDFGLARCQGGNNLTGMGDLIGTARYMSPEQIAGRTREVDYRSDIYSLGVTLYELLTLHHAFDGANREQLMRAIESRPPRPARRLNPAISVDLETIINKAMAKPRDERYASAGELADDLRCYLDGKPTLARRPSLVDRMAKMALRKKKVFAATFLVLLMVTVATTSAALMIARQRAMTEDAAGRSRLHLRQAHRVVQRFGGQLSDQMANLPGTETLRAQVLAEAVQYYSDFIRYAEDDRQLQAELAQVRYQLGAVYERLGRPRDAESQYTMAAEGLRAMIDRQPHAITYRAELALCLNNLGSVHKDLGQLETAYENYQQALAIQRVLVEESPETENVAREHAITQGNFALLCWAMGRDSDASDYFAAALETLERLQRASPKDVALQRQFLDTRSNWVAVLSQTDPERAEEVLRAAIVRAESIGERDPVVLATLQNNLAPLLLRRGQLTEASALCEAAIVELQQYVDAHPDLDSREQLAVARNNLGRVLSQLGNASASAQQLQQAEATLRELLHDVPERPELLSRLGGVLHNQAVLAEQAQRLDEAVKHLAGAIEHQAQAVELAPLNREYQNFLTAHREHLARVLRSIQEGSAAHNVVSLWTIQDPVSKGILEELAPRPGAGKSEKTQ